MNVIDIYLTKLANQLTVDKTKRDVIDNSYQILKGKIWEQYQDRLKIV